MIEFQSIMVVCESVCSCLMTFYNGIQYQSKVIRVSVPSLNRYPFFLDAGLVILEDMVLSRVMR